MMIRTRPRSAGRPIETQALARVGTRTKRLVQRLRPGDVAVIDHEDLDRVSAEALVAAGAAAVVNAAASISGRYPNLGPSILADAGIPLIDRVGTLALRKIPDGAAVRIQGDRVVVDDRVVAVGVALTPSAIAEATRAAGEQLGERFESFARNTVEYMQRERDLLFGGAGLPELRHRMEGRPVLVVVRGTGYREDLATLAPWIRDARPVLVGVDGGADALVEAGYRPDLIVGDMDSVSDETLRLAARHRAPTELVVHAYPDGRAPGLARLDALGLSARTVAATGTSEDVAFLLAHDAGAEAIVAVGSHGNLREFLDKGRGGMSSTFLVRLRVGEILMDAKGVSRIYAPRVRRLDAVLLVGAALFAMLAVVIVSPPLRLWAMQLVDDMRQWIFQLGGPA